VRPKRRTDDLSQYCPYYRGHLNTIGHSILSIVAAFQKCETCLRLWREYAAVTSVHVALDSDLRSFTATADLETIEQLARRAEAAADLRSLAREAIHTHEAEFHPEPQDPAR
jgi:hypothetical protein